MYDLVINLIVATNESLLKQKLGSNLIEVKNYFKLMENLVLINNEMFE